MTKKDHRYLSVGYMAMLAAYNSVSTGIPLNDREIEISFPVKELTDEDIEKEKQRLIDERSAKRKKRGKK